MASLRFISVIYCRYYRRSQQLDDDCLLKIEFSSYFVEQGVASGVVGVHFTQWKPLWSRVVFVILIYNSDSRRAESIGCKLNSTQFIQYSQLQHFLKINFTTLGTWNSQVSLNILQSVCVNFYSVLCWSFVVLHLSLSLTLFNGQFVLVFTYYRIYGWSRWRIFPSSSFISNA